ncbi:MAG: RNA 2',3'-cyclic phosphodiesterase [Longimicrobiales bacterium]
MRLFIAINLPSPVRDALYQAAAPLRRAAPSVRWTHPDALHITIKFLGEIATNRQATIEIALQSAARHVPPFQLRLRGVGGFPNLRRPRVLWLGAKADPSLLQLQADIEQSMEPLGFAREARAFHPHVTVARVGPDVSGAQLEQAERAVIDVKYEMEAAVRSVELMQSQLLRGGARYHILASVPLGAGVEPK